MMIRCLRVDIASDPEIIDLYFDGVTVTFMDVVRQTIGAQNIENVFMGIEDGFSVNFLIDEEGKVKNKDFCRAFQRWGSGGYIAGPFLIVAGDADFNYMSLTDGMMQRWFDMMKL